MAQLRCIYSANDIHCDHIADTYISTDENLSQHAVSQNMQFLKLQLQPIWNNCQWYKLTSHIV